MTLAGAISNLRKVGRLAVANPFMVASEQKTREIIENDPALRAQIEGLGEDVRKTVLAPVTAVGNLALGGVKFASSLLVKTALTLGAGYIILKIIMPKVVKS